MSVAKLAAAGLSWTLDAVPVYSAEGPLLARVLSLIGDTPRDFSYTHGLPLDDVMEAVLVAVDQSQVMTYTPLWEAAMKVVNERYAYLMIARRELIRRQKTQRIRLVKRVKQLREVNHE